VSGIQDFKTKVLPVKAIQFKGGVENAKVIADWYVAENFGGVAEHSEENNPWPELIVLYGVFGRLEVPAGFWIVRDYGGNFIALPDEYFQTRFERADA